MRAGRNARARPGRFCLLLSSVLVGFSLIGVPRGSAAEALTAADREYLKNLGYEEHAFSLEKATKGQRRYLHRVINSRRISQGRKVELINNYLIAIGIEAPLR